MRINYKSSQVGMLSGVLILMAVTLYMALAGPYVLFNLKQKETSQLKTVIIVARHGDEMAQDDLFFVGEQLTPLSNIGKERMYLLGKFLRLRYYERLLSGDPRRLHVRSTDSDKCLESAQLLAAGLNPPKAGWIWSKGGPDHEFAAHWQPIAVHTTDERVDDLLSSRSTCLLGYESSAPIISQSWKNSTKYLRLLNEFRHDLQVLRQNTGLEFEDDLEVLVSIDEQLKARAIAGNAPGWYTTTLAQRLAHIADVTAGCKFGQRTTQRLYAGRLLDSIARNIFAHVQKASAGSEQSGALTTTVALTEEDDEFDRLRSDVLGCGDGTSKPGERCAHHHATLAPITAPIIGTHLPQTVSLYVTDRQHITALLNALKIYSTQPYYGFLFIIELHYDPTNKVHFLRLFTVNSMSHNTFPEPVRVNPIACPPDSVECSPEQFEKNIRPLLVDKHSWWQKLCKNFNSPSSDLDLEPHNNNQGGPTTSSADLIELDEPSTTQPSSENDKLDEILTVGPIHVKPLDNADKLDNPKLNPNNDEIQTTPLTSVTNANDESNPELGQQVPSNTQKPDFMSTSRLTSDKRNTSKTEMEADSTTSKTIIDDDAIVVLADPDKSTNQLDADSSLRDAF